MVLACIIGVMSISSTVYADEVSTGYSSENVPEGYLGMIVDKDGNITELIPMPNSRYAAPYVGRVFTLAPESSFISYQYKCENYFIMGFKFYDVSNNYVDQITTRDRTLKLEMFASESIGGARVPVDDGQFSTNYVDNINSDYLGVYYDQDQPCIELIAFLEKYAFR